MSNDEVDLVTELGRVLEAVADRSQELSRGAVGESAQSYRTIEEAHCRDRIAALKSAIAAVRCTTPDGAAVQVAVAADILDDLADNVAHWAKPERHSELEEMHRAARRLLFSAAGFLTDRVEYAGGVAVDYCLPEWLNPWKPYEINARTAQQEAA